MGPLVSPVLYRGVARWAVPPTGARNTGRVGLAAVYLSSGLFASLVSAIFLPRAVCVGASGAICGVFGAYWADFLHRAIGARSSPHLHMGG